MTTLPAATTKAVVDRHARPLAFVDRYLHAVLRHGEADHAERFIARPA
jgi:hypothetical protein